MSNARFSGRRDDSHDSQAQNSPGQMNDQFRPASADSPAGYGPGRTSRGELRDGDPQPYRIRRVEKGMARVDPNLGGHQPGGMQLRDDNYSQQEIDNWEVDEGNPWVGGYGPYPGGRAAPYPGYSAGPIQWPMGMQPMQQMQQQAHNMRQFHEHQQAQLQRQQPQPQRQRKQQQGQNQGQNRQQQRYNDQPQHGDLRVSSETFVLDCMPWGGW